MNVLSPESIFLVTAWSAFSVAALSPGPNMLAVMERAFGTGRKSAIGVAIGISSGSFLWAITTSIGLGYFANKNPFVIAIIGIAGGYFFIKLSITRFRAGYGKKPETLTNPVHSSSFQNDVKHGFLVILSNPKVAFFWISLSVLIEQAGLNYIQVGLFACVCALTALTIYTIEALIFTTNQVQNIYYRVQHFIDIGFSILFSLIGIYLMWFGVQFIIERS